MVRGVKWALLGVIIVVAACSGSTTGAPASPSSPTPPSATTVVPTAEQSGSTASASPSPAQAVLPGESWIAYSWVVDGGEGAVWLSRPDGRDQHPLEPGIPGAQGHPDWSPDGSQIVFVKTLQEANEAIWIMNSDGSNAHEIVPAHGGCCGQDHPYWSPDGTSISFMRWIGPEATATSQVEVYDVATGSLRVAASAKMPVILDQPHWSPDGRTFAVEVSTANPDGSCCAAGSIGLIPVATGKLAILTDAVPLAGAPDWRPDGKAIVFDSIGLSYFENTTADQATNLYVINVDGTGLTQLTHNGPGGMRATEPFWRADGSIGYIETEANRSFNRIVRFIGADGTQLSDPARPIFATHPRIRPGT